MILTGSEKVFSGTVVNRALSSLHGGSLEITLTVSFSKMIKPRFESLYFSGSSSPKDASSKTCKGGKVERRESTRLQNAAKLLRNLSKSKDVGQIQVFTIFSTK